MLCLQKLHLFTYKECQSFIVLGITEVVSALPTMQSSGSSSSAFSRSSSQSQQQQQQQPTSSESRSTPPTTRRRKKNAADSSLFARFQIVLLVATLTLWYMISIAETSIRTTSSNHYHHHHPFFDDNQDDVDCSKQEGGSSIKSQSIISSNNFQQQQSRKQLLQQIQSTSELTQTYQLLTIAIDSRHSCPDLCTFVHPLLPSWVRYRQLHFDDEIDLANKLHDDFGHVIVVARTNIVNIANWAVQRRTTNYTTNTNNKDGLIANTVRIPPTTGLFHNADERFHKGEIVNVYDKFDYVLRQYYRKDDDGKFHGYTLNALGNYTCGTTDQSLPLVSSTTNEGGGSKNKNDNNGPTWGIHYVPLNAHQVDVQLLHHVTANYPTSLRPTNCSFIGRPDVKRSRHERSTMQSAVQEYGSEMNCTITFTGSFASGVRKGTYFLVVCSCGFFVSYSMCT